MRTRQCGRAIAQIRRCGPLAARSVLWSSVVIRTHDYSTMDVAKVDPRLPHHQRDWKMDHGVAVERLVARDGRDVRQMHPCSRYIARFKRGVPTMQD